MFCCHEYQLEMFVIIWSITYGDFVWGNCMQMGSFPFNYTDYSKEEAAEAAEAEIPEHGVPSTLIITTANGTHWLVRWSGRHVCLSVVSNCSLRFSFLRCDLGY